LAELLSAQELPARWREIHGKLVGWLGEPIVGYNPNAFQISRASQYFGTVGFGWDPNTP
jgi:hypothetical protein